MLDRLLDRLGQTECVVFQAVEMFARSASFLCLFFAMLELASNYGGRDK